MCLGLAVLRGIQLSFETDALYMLAVASTRIGILLAISSFEKAQKWQFLRRRDVLSETQAEVHKSKDLMNSQWFLFIPWNISIPVVQLPKLDDQDPEPQ